MLESPPRPPGMPIAEGEEARKVDSAIEVLATSINDNFFCAKLGQCANKNIVEKLRVLEMLPYADKSKEAFATELRSPGYMSIISNLHRDVENYMPDLLSVVTKLYSAKDIAISNSSIRYDKMISLFRMAISEYSIARPAGALDSNGERYMRLFTAPAAMPKPYY